MGSKNNKIGAGLLENASSFYYTDASTSKVEISTYTTDTYAYIHYTWQDVRTTKKLTTIRLV